MVRGLLDTPRMYLHVIASSHRDDGDLPEEPVAPTEPAPAPAPAPPPVLPSPSGVFLIHVAPSPKLDPSKPEDVAIVDDDDDLSTFIVD